MKIGNRSKESSMFMPFDKEAQKEEDNKKGFRSGSRMVNPRKGDDLFDTSCQLYKTRYPETGNEIYGRACYIQTKNINRNRFEKANLKRFRFVGEQSTTENYYKNSDVF
jgi:hypothetical protein